MPRRIHRLYVHVPFCRAKCAYCAFASEAPVQAPRVLAYLDALADELAAGAAACGPLTSVFIGGGTPTAIGVPALDRLLGLVSSSFELAPEVEWTVEANPETLDEATVATLARHGVNRVSVGVQSFNPGLRQVLGRHGDPVRVVAGLTILRRAGIRRLNTDLIYAIPSQDLEAWDRDLRTVLDLGVTHLSAYALTLEEGNRLAPDALDLPGDEVFEAMWQASDRISARYGLRRYEISNFAKPGHECQHNLGIWYGEPYLGCGPAASSFDGARRWTQPRTLTDWLAGVPPEYDEIPAAARAAEILAFGLRVLAGWNLNRFAAVTGTTPEAAAPEALAQLLDLGLLERAPGVLRATPAGILLHDAMAEMILHAPPAAAAEPVPHGGSGPPSSSGRARPS